MKVLFLWHRGQSIPLVKEIHSVKKFTMLCTTLSNITHLSPNLPPSPQHNKTEVLLNISLPQRVLSLKLSQQRVYLILSTSHANSGANTIVFVPLCCTLQKSSPLTFTSLALLIFLLLPWATLDVSHTYNPRNTAHSTLDCCSKCRLKKTRRLPPVLEMERHLLVIATTQLPKTRTKM